MVHIIAMFYCLNGTLLPVIGPIAGDFYSFQQDSARALRGRETTDLLQHETPDTIAPDLSLPNSSYVNTTDYRIWVVMQSRVYQKPVRDIDGLERRLIAAWSGIR